MKFSRKLISWLLVALMMLAPMSGMAEVLTGAAPGMGGDVKVEVTVEDGKITGVTVTEQNETPGLSDPAIEQVPAAIVAANSTEVESVSGATITSEAIKAAVAAALSGETAGETENVLTIEPDVIVVGGGLGGIATATRSAELDKKVLLLEGTGKLGGCLYFAGGSISAAGYKIQKEAGIEDTPDAYYDEIYNMNNGENLNTSMLRTYVDKAGVAIDWLDEYVGVDFGDRHVDGGGYQQTSAPRVTYALGKSAAGSAVGFLDAFTVKMDEFIEAGMMQVMLNSEVTELIAEGDAVVGVKVGDVEYRAPSVVLATGGYGASEEWLKKTIFTNVATSDPVTSNGSGLTLATSVGAKLGNMDYISPYVGAIPVDGFICTTRANTRYPGALWVNKHGERMVDEAFAMNDAKLPGQVWVGMAEDNIVYMVLSEGMLDKEQKLINPAMGGAALSNNGWDRFDELVADGTYIIKADTIEELGEKIGAANLAATVAQYNTDCAAGVDSVFGRTQNLTALEEGPFYALYTVPWVLQSAGGVVINEQAQVVHENGNPIPGLYAVGELIGSANIDGHVTVGGFIHSMVVTFSLIAAESIAAL